MNDTQTIEILKSLRLHAMASVYETSLRLAPGAAPSTDTLLAEMAEAEQSARRVRATERLLKRAALRIPASLDELTFSPERNLDRDLVSRLSSMRWVAEGASVLVTGPTGAGKSWRKGGERPRARVPHVLRVRAEEASLGRAAL